MQQKNYSNNKASIHVVCKHDMQRPMETFKQVPLVLEYRYAM